MTYRLVISLIVIALMVVPAGAFAQTKAARTPDSQPDLQGVWSFATITPMERPPDLAGKEFFTPEEAKAYEEKTLKATNKDRRDGPIEDDVRRAYNDFWWDSGTKIVKTRRTSLVIDPPDGRIPPLTPAAKERQTERLTANRGHEFDGPENRPLQERCIIWVSTGPPIIPTAYNNNIRIVQSPGYVSILTEMIHDARVIPLGNNPHIPQNVQQWKGDSRGHWEGDTLVIETTNFSGKTAFRGSSEKMHVTERFKRTDADTLLYQFTVNDPASFEKPWTVEIPIIRSPAPMYEYACHEGNYAMTGGLAGARAQEKSPD